MGQRGKSEPEVTSEPRPEGGEGLPRWVFRGSCSREKKRHSGDKFGDQEGK